MIHFLIDWFEVLALSLWIIFCISATFHSVKGVAKELIAYYFEQRKLYLEWQLGQTAGRQLPSSKERYEHLH